MLDLDQDWHVHGDQDIGRSRHSCCKLGAFAETG